VDPTPQPGHLASPEAVALTIHLPWQILASITRMPGPGSHCGLISIQSDVGKPVRRNNPAIQAARKSRQTPLL
jgi:hypothetical protein